MPLTRVPATDGVNEKVAATLLLLKTRSELKIWNELRVRYVMSCDIARIPLPRAWCVIRVGFDLSSVVG